MASSDSLTASQRALRARVAAFSLHAQGGTSTKAGTAAFLARFEREVDPDNTLSPDERARRAALARRAYMSRLALKASRARSRFNRPLWSNNNHRQKRSRLTAIIQREQAWAELHAAKPPGWWVSTPSHRPRRSVPMSPSGSGSGRPSLSVTSPIVRQSATRLWLQPGAR